MSYPYGRPPAPGYGAPPGSAPPGAYGAPPPGATGAPPPSSGYGAPPGGAPPNSYAPPGNSGPPHGAFGAPAGYGAPPPGQAPPGAPPAAYGAPPGQAPPHTAPVPQTWGGAPPGGAPPMMMNAGAPRPPPMGGAPPAGQPPIMGQPQPPGMGVRPAAPAGHHAAPPPMTAPPGGGYSAPNGGPPMMRGPPATAGAGGVSPAGYMGGAAPAPPMSAPGGYMPAAPPPGGAPPPGAPPPPAATAAAAAAPPAAPPPPSSNVQFYSTGNGQGVVPAPSAPRGPPPPSSAPVDTLAAQFGGMDMSGAPPPPMGGSPGPGGAGGAGGGAGGQQGGGRVPAVAIDEEANCSGKFMRMTVGKVPNSDAMAQAMKFPLGVVLTPMALDKQLDQDQCPVDVVNFGKTGIVRCKRCRTYVNPFVSWVNNGRQWRCNICGYVNECPSDYFSHLDADGQRKDKSQRPELSKGSVELVAPSEYMLRPPQAPVYLFVLDVSQQAVASGMLAQTAATLKACMDELPGQPRTQVGFVCFDSAVHFFNLKSTLSQPQMLTVPDLAELFLPLPDDLLVNLAESRSVIDSLLDALPSMFANTQRTEAALGPALVAGYRIMSHIGGKMVVCLSSLPSTGEAALKHRDDPRKLGAKDEHHQLNPADEWYKTKAVEFHRLQICVDLFLFSNQYTDVATLKELPKFTAGALHYYPAFYAPRDGPKFDAQLTRVLTRTTGWEAVMRVRATRGVRITTFHGNFSIRGTDLLALPNCHPDAAFALEMVHDDAVLSASVVSVQAALLYTTSSGERRIRVHTLAVPTSGLVEEVAASVDIDALCNILARQALDTALRTGLEPARLRLQNACVDILRGAKPQSHMVGRVPGMHGAPPGSMGGPGGGMGGPGGGPGGGGGEGEAPRYPDSLQLLPLYTMALQKNVVFRGGTDLRADERSDFMAQLNVMGIESSRYFVYPRMFSIHNLPPDACQPADEDDENAVGPEGGDKCSLPPMQNLSAERLTSDGVFMLENALDAFVWVGAATSPAVLQQLFGLASMDQGGDFSGVQLLRSGSDLATRVDRLLTALEGERGSSMRVFVVREGDAAASEAKFFRYLVEDRASFHGGGYSYGEFMALIGRQTR